MDYGVSEHDYNRRNSLRRYVFDDQRSVGHLHVLRLHGQIQEVQSVILLHLQIRQDNASGGDGRNMARLLFTIFGFRSLVVRRIEESINQLSPELVGLLVAPSELRQPQRNGNY